MKKVDGVRMAACLAAMDGISDPAAARVILDEPQTQHACELREALEQAVDRIEAGYSVTPLDGDAALIRKLRALLAKVKQ